MSHDIFNLTKALYHKFGMSFYGEPRDLDHHELAFRVGCLEEEQNEYLDAENLEQQYDALLDLMVFAAGTIERQGFKNPQMALGRVMRANMRKERAQKASDSKRSFAVDLIKPAGWRPPYLGDLSRTINSEARGLILLDGPDHCGKSTLADHMRATYDAHVIHSTWSLEIADRMFEYLMDTLTDAIEISRNQLTVLDRSWVSDYIYAEVYRGGATLSTNQYSQVQETFIKAGGVGCICLPRHKVTWFSQFTANSTSRNELYTEKMDVVYDAYKHLFSGVELVPFKNAYAQRLCIESFSSLQGLGFYHYDYLTAFANGQISVTSKELAHAATLSASRIQHHPV